MKAVVISALLMSSSSLALAAVPHYTVTALDAPADGTSTASSISLFGVSGQINHGSGSSTPAKAQPTPLRADQVEEPKAKLVAIPVNPNDPFF